MIAEYFKLAIEYIFMVFEGWFDLVIESWQYFPWFVLGFAGFLLSVVLHFVLRKVYR